MSALVSLLLFPHAEAAFRPFEVFVPLYCHVLFPPGTLPTGLTSNGLGSDLAHRRG